MGLVGENKDTGMERRHRAVMNGGREGRRANGNGGRGEVVVPERIWTKPLHPSGLKLPSLLRALRVAVGNVRIYEGETNTYQVSDPVLGVLHTLIQCNAH